MLTFPAHTDDWSDKDWDRYGQQHFAALGDKIRPERGPLNCYLNDNVRIEQRRPEAFCVTALGALKVYECWWIRREMVKVGVIYTKPPRRQEQKPVRVRSGDARVKTFSFACQRTIDAERYARVREDPVLRKEGDPDFDADRTVEPCAMLGQGELGTIHGALGRVHHQGQRQSERRTHLSRPGSLHPYVSSS